MAKPLISVCFVIKNGVKQGYPFWDSLESALPFADEFVISEGKSQDGTRDWVDKFAAKHPGLVRVFEDDWDSVKSPYGEVISVVSMRTMRRCMGKWVYYLQADEIVHEANCDFIIDIAKRHSHEFNSVSFRFAHFLGGWEPAPNAAYKEAIRMVQNVPGIKLLGDAWTFTGEVSPICPAGLSPKPLYHLGWVFPAANLQKTLEHGRIYRKHAAYQKEAQRARDELAKGDAPLRGYPVPANYVDYPERVKRLVGQPFYEFPEGAF